MPTETLVRTALALALESDDVPRWATRLDTAPRIERRRIARTAARVLELIDAATTPAYNAGLDWYRAARDETAARAPHLDISTAARIVAAVSPRLRWSLNLDAFDIVLDAARRGVDIETAVLEAGNIGAPGGWLPWTLARSILETAAPLTGDKRLAFARCIETAGQTHHVAVDGHATLAALNGIVSTRRGIGSAPSLTPPVFDSIAAAYATAAAHLDITPAQTQAVAWVVWRGIETTTGRR